MDSFQLQFKSIPPSVFAGFFNQTPFIIELSSTAPNKTDYKINLYSQNSNSAPFQQPQNKWSHLLPQWGFFDYKGEYIEFITPKYKQQDGDFFIYEASAYYVDNMPGNVELIAVFETSGLQVSDGYSVTDLPSYSNSLIFDKISYEVLKTTPHILKISQDGKNPIDWFKWTNTKIPFVVSFHPESSSTLLNTNIYNLTNVDPVVFTIPEDNSSLMINLSVFNIPQSSISWDQSSAVFLSAYDQYGFSIGGFYKGWFETVTPYLTANIVASGVYDSTLFISKSENFQIKPLERPYEIRRFNESWDSGKIIKSYALAEHTFNNPVFFDNYIEVSVGGLENHYQSLGRSMYERIANFVKNHSDIDTCNLIQFYSLHKAIDVPIDDYRFDYPPELRRLVDILSINKNRILGGFCKCNRNFNNQATRCNFCGHSHSLNRDTVGYRSDEYYVSADKPFVIENVYAIYDESRFDVLYPSVCELGGETTALMSDLPSISWLLSSQYFKYIMYDYISSFCGEQQEGVVNWGDTRTTISSSFITEELWYGDNGIVEELVNYEIHRGLYNG